MESANNDISKMDHHEAINLKAAKKKNIKFQSKVKQTSSNSSGKTEVNSIKKSTKKNWVCYCCGKFGHTKPSCKYISYKCSICNKVGHLKNVCKNKEKNVNNVDLNDAECDNFFINLIITNVKSITDLDICTEIKKDQVLSEVYFRVLSNKWPDKIKKVDDELKPYFNRRNELTIEVGCLLWGHRIVVPGKFRNELLNELHHTHMGTVKMKSVARSYIWWPGIDNDIQNITKSCVFCLAHGNNPPKSVLHSWPWPEGPSQRVHLDFLGLVDGKMFIVIIDSFFKVALC